MELERGMLATKAMGWHRSMAVGWEISSQMGSLPCYRSADGTFQCLWCKWDPFTSWPQAGMVIEAMWVDWDWHIFTLPSGAFVCDVISKKDKSNAWSANDHSFCYAVALAAYRALEATDE